MLSLAVGRNRSHDWRRVKVSRCLKSRVGPAARVAHQVQSHDNKEIVPGNLFRARHVFLEENLKVCVTDGFSLLAARHRSQGNPGPAEHSSGSSTETLPAETRSHD